METSIVKIEQVSKSFLDEEKREKVIDTINLEIKRGEFLAIIGPSGSGKSTLLRCLSGLIKPDTGRISIDGLPPEKCLGKNLGFVFQDFALFWWMTVADNPAFGLKMKGVKKWEQKKLAHEHLNLMGLKGFEDDYPDELSIGMRQRVGFARALAIEPELLIMDEPFSSLDAFTAEKLRNELLLIWQKENEKEQGGMTVVMVTHLVEEAVAMADRIVVLTPRPAKIERIVENTLLRPRDKKDAGFYRLVDTITTLVAA